MIITPKDHSELVDLGKRLLDAAGDDPSRVRTSFQGSTMSYEIDDDLARAIGRTPDEVRVNEQPILRDTVGVVGDPQVLPNVVPGTNQSPDVPASVNDAKLGNDELIKQPEDTSPKVAGFGEGIGDVEGQTTSGSTGQDGDRAGVTEAGQPADSQDATSQDAGEQDATQQDAGEQDAGEQDAPAKKSRKK